ncbi:hypothetical protein [Xanthobacter pseudotagetidis]|uniref:hypothetical protein n=1 Tax=Xanthobacter pseudotagetidis TaxID=3119911 RepID=UPI0037269ED1
MSSKPKLYVDIYKSTQTGRSSLNLSISSGIAPGGGLSGYRNLKGGGIGYSENSLGERVVNFRIVPFRIVGLDMNYNEATQTLETLQVGPMIGLGGTLFRFGATLNAKLGFGLDTPVDHREWGMTIQLSGVIAIPLVPLDLSFNFQDIVGLDNRDTYTFFIPTSAYASEIKSEFDYSGPGEVNSSVSQEATRNDVSVSPDGRLRLTIRPEYGELDNDFWMDDATIALNEKIFMI